MTAALQWLQPPAATTPTSKRLGDASLLSTMSESSYLEANAYHAIVGWALGGRMLEIKVRDDRPGEHTRLTATEHLRLIDRVAFHNAGHEAEDFFGRSLPDWASSRDRTDTLNVLATTKFARYRKGRSGSRTDAHAREKYWQGTSVKSTR
jgi:hypothetical protein